MPKVHFRQAVLIANQGKSYVTFGCKRKRSIKQNSALRQEGLNLLQWGYSRYKLAEHHNSNSFAEPCPELWMLGASGGSAAFAGQRGFNMSLGLFISPDDQTIAIMDEHKRAYQQSGHSGSPRTMITIAALCAPTRKEAFYLAASQAYWKVMAFRHGIRNPWISPEEALDKAKQLSISDQSYYQSLLNSVTLGSPQECADQLAQISEYWKTDEVGLVAMTHDFESNKRSFELLAKALLV